ncbi:hypothetical protein ABGB12_20440 [Actinocorallia sp. B10E7]|uniref:hypothetical protein n=1 Tax=Actinocorallia sp. B10E7 TaxID=3153558 RepID=UPI00325EB07C
MWRHPLAVGVLAAASSLISAGPASAEDLGAWRAIPLNFTWGPERGVTDLEATGPAEAWVSGFQGALTVYGPVYNPPYPGAPSEPSPVIFTVNPKPVLQRWTGGTGWTGYSPPGMGGEGIIRAVASTAPNDVWFCGNTWSWGKVVPWAARYGGQKIEQTTTPLTGTCTGIAVLGSDVFLSEVGRVHRFHDGAWTSFDADQPAFTLSDPEAGLYAKVGGVLHRWDGSGFAPLPAALTAEPLLITQKHGFWTFRESGPFRWDGAAWQPVEKPAHYSVPYGFTNGTWNTVYYTDADGPWFAPYTTDRNASIYHWNGTGWDAFAPNFADSSSAQLPRGLRDDGSGRVWAVVDGERSYLDGTTWTQVPEAADVESFRALPGGKVLAYKVGDGGITAKTTAPLP